MTKENKDVYVLGINHRPLGGMDIGHHPAAAILKNGKPVAMCEEERFVRIKEAPGRFPLAAIQFCLKQAGITIHDIDAIGWNWDPVLAVERSRSKHGTVFKGLSQLTQFGLRNTPLRSLGSIFSEGVLPERAVDKLKSSLLYWFGVTDIPVHCFDHHLAHAASAYYASGFEKSTIITWDCWGDHLSGTVSRGADGDITVVEEIPFSRMSIGMLNDFVYEFLRTSEKGNLMGLAPYGKPQGYLSDLVDIDALTMRMDLLTKHAPFPAEFMKKAGGPRRLGEEIEQRHKDLAADLQQTIEAIGMKLTKMAVQATGERNLCLAGGCALNATLNGKLGRSGLVDQVFIQPESGDGGGALGAAYLTHRKLGHPLPPNEMRHAYWGPSFTNDEIIEQLKIVKVPYEFVSDNDIPDVVSGLIADGNIMGWFQQGSEWGPRALGGRSILADPRMEEVRDRVNVAIKYRDWWRPFAPSMLADQAPEYLENSFFSPFMVTTFQVPERHRSEMKGVTHLDGSTRPQMVQRDVNPRYYDMISAFGKKSGVPMVLNTSFNLKGEPMVNSPRDALRTFYSSALDALLMNNIMIRKTIR
jgi:carbamoyltransferase